MNRQEIIAYLGADWERVQALIQDALHSDVGLLEQTNGQILSNSGKLLRPLVSLLVSRSLGTPSEDSVRFAAATELLHNATLLHDDVTDGSAQRRGRPTVAALLGPSAAVLVGDFWLARAVENLAFFPYLMPAMAFGTIYLAVATSASFKWMYGSFFLLGLVASVKFLPFASRSGVSSMMQIAPEIEEAATIFGVPWAARMRRILFPIQKSAIISGYLLPVINVMREVALFTLLVPYPRYLLTTMLFSFNETGYAQYGSAVTLLIILIIIVINTLVNKFTGASFDKGIGG